MASAVLIGWLVGSGSFTTFGMGAIAAQPLTALIFAAMAAALLFTLRDADRYRTALLFCALVMVLLSQGHLLGDRFAIEELLSRGLLKAAAAQMPIGFVTPTTCALFLLLLVALTPATATDRWQARAALTLATLVMMIGGVVLIAYINQVDVRAAPNHVFMMSFPSAAMSFVLATSIIIWRYRDGWPAIFWTAAEDSAGSSLLLLILILVLVEFGFRLLALNGLVVQGIGDAMTLVANIAIVIAIVVLSSRRLMERRRERDQLAGAIELAAVMVVGRDGVILHWSRGCEDLYGWPAALAVGRRRADLLRTVRAISRDEIWTLLETTRTLEGEVVEYHRDGHQLTIHNHAKILSRASDRSSIVVAVTDVTERRGAQAALQASEARLRAAIDVQELTIIDWNIANRQIDWSVNVEAMCGPGFLHTREDFMGWGERCIDRDDWRGLQEDVQAAMKGGGLRFRRTVSVRQPGSTAVRLFEIAGLFVYEKAVIARVIVACNDVTEHYQREEAIMVGEARLATAVAAQGIFIYEYDLLTQQPIWTTRGESFLGATDSTPFDAPASYWNSIPDIAHQVGIAVTEAIANGKERTHFSFQFERLDGVQRHADSWARIVRDEEGHPTRVIGTHLDITERYERESALRASEAEMRAILATVPDAMIVCDEHGVIRAFSAAAESLFGYPASEMIGCDIVDLAADDGADREAKRRKLFRTVLRIHDGMWPAPLMVQISTGEVVPVSFVLGEALVEGQRMFVAFGRDMRPDMASEEKFHKLQNQLAQAARLGTMGEMAAALAHELSQPLAAIVNFLGAAELMMQADRENDRLRNAVRNAGQQASRAGEIIRRLRAFISRGETDMRVEPVARLIREAAALTLLSIPSLGVRLNYDFEDEHRAILGDRIQIQQVLVNLIRNGVDAMTSGGGARREMIISTKIQQDNFLEVAVRDSGPGIDPDIMDSLFSPFATTKNDGLGFGLSICRRIIEAHGGQLSADTGTTGGAVFRFTLPIMDEERR